MVNENTTMCNVQNVQYILYDCKNCTVLKTFDVYEEPVWRTTRKVYASEKKKKKKGANETQTTHADATTDEWWVGAIILD